MSGPYRSPATSAAVTSARISWTSSLLSWTWAAPMFSSRYLIFLVPGITKNSGPWARIQAKTSWDGLTPFLAARFSICLTSCRLREKFSGEKRGSFLLKSSSAKSSRDLMAPVKIPRPRGELFLYMVFNQYFFLSFFPRKRGKGLLTSIQ